MMNTVKLVKTVKVGKAAEVVQTIKVGKTVKRVEIANVKKKLEITGPVTVIDSEDGRNSLDIKSS